MVFKELLDQEKLSKEHSTSLQRSVSLPPNYSHKMNQTLVMYILKKLIFLTVYNIFFFWWMNV